MKNENKLIPRLRFPEFVNEGKWDIKTIDSIGHVVTGNTPSKENIEYWGSDYVWVTAQDFKEKYIFDSVLKLTEKGKNQTRFLPKNSVLVTCIASIGLNSINKVECATNQQINAIILNSLHHFEFVYYSINVNTKRLKNLAGQTAVQIVNKSTFEKFKIQLPKSLKEQKKIASCLSSLDDLITAHSQKLEVLKEHKKGLMQVLFPQDGEKVPKLRFPEFENEGEWEEKKLGDCGNVVPSGDLDFNSFSADYTTEHIYPIYSNCVSNKGLYGYNTYPKYKKDSVTITARGTLGVAFFRPTEFVGIGRLLVVSDLIDDDPIFLKENWNYYARIPLENGGIPQLTASKAKFVTLLFPKLQEQQKIASCLSYLDELIIAQDEKIEQLKLHKKGLTQGLFPNIKE